MMPCSVGLLHSIYLEPCHLKIPRKLYHEYGCATNPEPQTSPYMWPGEFAKRVRSLLTVDSTCPNKTSKLFLSPESQHFRFKILSFRGDIRFKVVWRMVADGEKPRGFEKCCQVEKVVQDVHPSTSVFRVQVLPLHWLRLPFLRLRSWVPDTMGCYILLSSLFTLSHAMPLDPKPFACNYRDFEATRLKP